MNTVMAPADPLALVNAFNQYSAQIYENARLLMVTSQFAEGQGQKFELKPLLVRAALKLASRCEAFRHLLATIQKSGVIKTVEINGCNLLRQALEMEGFLLPLANGDGYAMPYYTRVEITNIFKNRVAYEKNAVKNALTMSLTDREAVLDRLVNVYNRADDLIQRIRQGHLNTTQLNLGFYEFHQTLYEGCLAPQDRWPARGYLDRSLILLNKLVNNANLEWIERSQEEHRMVIHYIRQQDNQAISYISQHVRVSLNRIRPLLMNEDEVREFNTNLFGECFWMAQH